MSEEAVLVPEERENSNPSEWSWKEIIAQEVSDFLFDAPKSIADVSRRVAVLFVAVFLGLSGYLVVRAAPAIQDKVFQQTEDALKQELAEPEHAGTKAEIEKWLSRWYGTYQPQMLALLSWREIPQLEGLWVQPESYQRQWLGPRPLFPELRQTGGAFSFNECGQTAMHATDSVIIVCPIQSDVTTWGLLVAIMPPDKVGATDAGESLRQLATTIAQRIY
jgi:hypothetical protein